VTLYNLGRGPVLLPHDLQRKEKQHSLNPSNSPFSFVISLFSSFRPSFFLGIGKEVRREQHIMLEDVRVHEGDCLLS
jgi:hypothetical protein